jgi:hypothetical protein
MLMLMLALALALTLMLAVQSPSAAKVPDGWPRPAERAAAHRRLSVCGRWHVRARQQPQLPGWTRAPLPSIYTWPRRYLGGGGGSY